MRGGISPPFFDFIAPALQNPLFLALYRIAREGNVARKATRQTPYRRLVACFTQRGEYQRHFSLARWNALGQSEIQSRMPVCGIVTVC
jgi:hypothetical protein